MHLLRQLKREVNKGDICMILCTMLVFNLNLGVGEEGGGEALLVSDDPQSPIQVQR